MQRLEANRHKILKIMFLEKGVGVGRELFAGKLPILTSYRLSATNYVPNTSHTLSPILTTMLYGRNYLLVIRKLGLGEVKQVLQSLTVLLLSCSKDWALVTTPVYSLPSPEQRPHSQGRFL